MPQVRGSHFRRVDVVDEYRGGLLGQGSILTITSHPVRTSPVFRGKWILTTILGTPPPDPPPNVPPLPDKGGAYAGTTPSNSRLIRNSAGMRWRSARADGGAPR